MQPKPKRKSVPRLKRKLWSVFSRYVRLRDCMATTGTLTRGCCITCGVEFPFNQLQAGHYIAGRNNAVLYNEEMVHAQCAHCNFTLEGNHPKYTKAIIRMYGEDAPNRMELESERTFQYSALDIEELTCYYKEEIGKLEMK